MGQRRLQLQPVKARIVFGHDRPVDCRKAIMTSPGPPNSTAAGRGAYAIRALSDWCLGTVLERPGAFFYWLCIVGTLRTLHSCGSSKSSLKAMKTMTPMIAAKNMAGKEGVDSSMFSACSLPARPDGCRRRSAVPFAPTAIDPSDVR